MIPYHQPRRRVQEHRITITIARIAVDVLSSASPTELGLLERMQPFLKGAEHPARVRIKWQPGEPPRSVPGQIHYDPGSVWRLYRDGSDYYAAFYYGTKEGETPRGVLWINADWSDFALTEQPAGSGWRSLLSVGASELVFRSRIVQSGGLILHAAGLDDNGRGIVLTGHSGAGKSTQTCLWSTEAGVVPMSDDRTAIRLEDDGPYCYGTPWNGTAQIGADHSAPLAGIVVLGQGTENHIERISSSAAAPLLSARCFLPYWDRGLMKLALANLRAILEKVPVYSLVCRPEREVIPLVRSALCK